MNTRGPEELHVACLCAAWCRTCDAYRPVFEQAMAALRQQHPALLARWIDIEDQAELLGDFDVETFPTLVVVVGAQLRFAGALTPQAETLQRVLRMALESTAPAGPSAEALAFAQRLRLHPPRLHQDPR